MRPASDGLDGRYTFEFFVRFFGNEQLVVEMSFLYIYIYALGRRGRRLEIERER